jgi:AcrR family transcriptional regulator
MGGMMTEGREDVQDSTRERLLRAGMRLFAEKGFRATTVGEIEAAVGLQPRRGALYKHFPSKKALLEAAVERHLEAVDEARGSMDVFPFTDVRTEAQVLGRWLLSELDAERETTRILEQDGDLLPELRDRVRARVSDAGYRATAALIARWVGDADDLDVDAFAVNLLGPLINFRRSTWTFTGSPLGLDDERVLAAWVELCVLAFAGRRRP